MNLNLDNVHVLVTGASGGIGLATARRFLGQGANVAAHYNTNNATLAPLLAEYGPTRVRAAQASLEREDDVGRLFEHADSFGFGAVQVLVVNHGYYPPEDAPLAHMSLRQWEATFATNVTSSFLVVRAYLQRLERASDEEKARAAIVLIGSTAGKYGEAGHADYAATKSAMMYGLTLSLKNEIVKIAPKGRVNCVAPGWTKTPMAAEALQNPDIVTPLKKVATPEDVANQVVILSSSTVSGHVTGQILMVEGGMEGRLLNMPGDLA
ncbi:3-oxoacyl-[acyl-carrier-protein] reductase FabG [Grifola frondosa]|uniref:3-oxoacyl-[acyl-carrier-protein] reductase FabG n=1 Tax=Grifola frondosa TaxID=5627 RepID=A0A1C7MCD7_GRIFR|nr:3-oxoacyl-[acyl-carrier-protein] reductase FabG [Grifola frondosa]